MTAAAKPLGVAAAGLNEALISINRMSELARVIQGLLPNNSDSDQAEAVVEALVDMTVMASNRVHGVLQRLDGQPLVHDAKEVTEAAHRRATTASLPIGPRVDIALAAASEIGHQTEALVILLRAAEAIEPEVTGLFLARITTLGNAALSALGDANEDPAKLRTRVFGPARDDANGGAM